MRSASRACGRQIMMLKNASVKGSAIDIDGTIITERDDRRSILPCNHILSVYLQCYTPTPLPELQSGIVIGTQIFPCVELMLMYWYSMNAIEDGNNKLTSSLPVRNVAIDH
jgi:hypothetical protein